MSPVLAALVSLLAMIVPTLLVCFLFSLLFVDYNGLIKAWLNMRHKARMGELKTRNLEALAKMEEPARQRLLETMPDWLDKKDEKDIEAWKKSRQEVIGISEKKG